MKRPYLLSLVILLLVVVQLPYIWLIWLQPKPIPLKTELIYLKPNLQRNVDIDWFNPEPVRDRWYRFESSSDQPIPTVLRSTDNLTLWLRISNYNRAQFNVTRIRNIQLWMFNIWSPNSTHFGSLWKLDIYLQGRFDRTQMIGIPNNDTGTQLILNWDDYRINYKAGEILRIDLHFESIVPVDAVLVIKSMEILVIAQ
jgi:hypothetical protein